ncbi:MAG: heme biosynthesis HemY N-terminal domain-containing protein [Alphaproteobacteria bacterium]|nr:heme biosynthesis HemY N-terminal domain-containing protein [Alphaproteobacteria bacterium]
MTWRVFFFLIKIGIVGALAVFFAVEPGRVSFDWQGYAIDMPVGIFVLIVLLLVLLLVYAERIRQSIFRFPSRWRAHRKAIREMKGYRALTLGMVAVAAGDANEAKRQSRRSTDLLTQAPLTKLLQAQSAQLNGDDQAALKYFEDMRGNPEVSFLGIRGLMTQALRDGDSDRALALAEEARKLRPSAKWVLLELLDLQMEAGFWNRALATLEDAEKTGALPTEEAKPLRAKLSLRQAARLKDSGQTGEALKIAKKAMKADPSNDAAVVLTADLMQQNKDTRKAEKLIEAAWKQHPSPVLAESYRSLAASDATPLAKVKRFEALLSLAPDAADSHIALADAALDASLWGEARTHLAKATDILGEPVPPTLCRLWARLEEAEHGDLTAAHRWLKKASEAEEKAQAAPSDLKLPARLGESTPL